MQIEVRNKNSIVSMLFNHKAMTEELLLVLLQENYITGFLPKAGDSSVHSAL